MKCKEGKKICTYSSVMSEPSDCIECRTCTRNPMMKPMEVGDHFEPYL